MGQGAECYSCVRLLRATHSGQLKALLAGYFHLTDLLLSATPRTRYQPAVHMRPYRLSCYAKFV